MKLRTLLLSVIFMLMGITVLSQEVDRNLAENISKNFLEYQGKNYQTNAPIAFESNTLQLAWITELSPNGFILISASKKLRPVLAYSFESGWNNQGEEGNIFQTLIKSDIECRLTNTQSNGKELQVIHNEWKALSMACKSKNRYEQWPPEGTTPTGGWLFTNWTQGSPYNKMCPIDGSTHQRSLAGCPATAMSMILNCLMEINETKLMDSDDYYHNYGSGNQYWIDDDWSNFGFPCFDSLNLYLDSVQENYAGHKPLITPQISALTFACGVALKQVYTSSISGTFGIEQAADAFQRFGFADSRLVYDSDTALATNLAQNIKTGWPAQLGLLSPPPNQVGHNVVVDGYNTDDYFHFNFGWGGNSNGWYTMPPTTIPYNLTVIEGIVLDIKGDNPHVGIFEINSKNVLPLRLSWNATNQTIIMKSNFPNEADAEISIFNINGSLIEQATVRLNQGENIQYQPNLNNHGLYILTVVINNSAWESIKFIF